MPRYYRKEYVEARQWFDTDANREEFATWFEAHDCEFGTVGPRVLVGVWVDEYADPGDWIVLGTDDVEEYFYAVKPDVFAGRYTAEVLP